MGFSHIASAQDLGVYADSITEAIVRQARARQASQDSLVRDYRARVHSRLDASVGRSRFARLVPLAVVEHVADVHWSFPDDLRIDYVGMRERWLFDPAELPGVRGDLNLQFDQPWFIPRAFSNRIQIVGGIPDRGALHPFAQGAERFYRYTTTDSVTLVLPERQVEVIGIEVRPRTLGEALIAGTLWVDRDTGDVVRMTFFLLGDQLWDEDAEDNATIQQVLRVEAEIEYTLWDQRYWLPLRELVTLYLREPWITGVQIPVRSVVTFSDYRVNTGSSVAFADLPDTDDGSDRGHGFRRSDLDGDHRWQIVSPPADSLRGFGDWETTLAFSPESGDETRILEMASELAELAEGMPDGWVGRRSAAFAEYGRVLRFNRVQGLSLGLTYQFEPRWSFTTLQIHGRYGLSDGRPLASAILRRDLPSGLWDWELSRSLHDVDPWSRGLDLTNTINALFAGHDGGEYVLVDRAGFRRTSALSATASWSVSVAVENHHSVATQAESRLNDVFFGDGVFQPNRPVREGVYGVLATQFDVRAPGVSWSAGGGALADDELVVARLFNDLRVQRGAFRGSLMGGAVSRPDVPQMLIRSGGLHTVRGYEFAERLGEAMWAVQVEASLGRRRFVAPFVFADVGNADRFARAFTRSPLIGVGGGLSLNLIALEGRLQFSKAVGRGNDEPLRVDLLFRPPL